LKNPAKTKNRYNGRYHGNGELAKFNKKLNKDLTKYSMALYLLNRDNPILPEGFVKEADNDWTTAKVALKRIRYWFKVFIAAHDHGVVNLGETCTELRSFVRRLNYARRF
jgi:hypothetical protein